MVFIVSNDISGVSTHQLIVALRDEVLLACHDCWVRLKQLYQMVDSDLCTREDVGPCVRGQRSTDWLLSRVHEEDFDDNFKFSPSCLTDLIGWLHHHCRGGGYTRRGGREGGREGGRKRVTSDGAGVALMEFELYFLHIYRHIL